jgi:hypothetical protein
VVKIRRANFDLIKAEAVMGKRPQRMCVVCRKRDEKSKFMKLVRNKAGEFKFAEGHAEGRGAYLCRDEKCIEQAIKKKAFNRAFKMVVPNEVYEVLTNSS